MRKVKSSRHNLTALAVVLSLLTMAQNVTMSQATASPSVQRSTSNVVNLDNEVRVLDRFVDDWANIFKQHGVLNKRAAITSGEFDAFKSSSEGLRNRCSEFQTAIRDLVQKLKDADRWNALDDELLAKTNNQKLISSFRETGGPKRLLAEASSSFCSGTTSEITGPVESLRRKLSAQVRDSSFDQGLVRVSYAPEPPVFQKAFRCLGSIARVYGRMIIGDKNYENSQAYKNWDCFCFDTCSSPAT